MSTFPSSVWDRLIEPLHSVLGQFNSTRLSIAQYQRAIARDLEVLLNTRVGIAAEDLAPYPACVDSIINFGLADFADLCMTSGDDRKEICDRLTAAIERHEPRLVHVRAHLLDDAGVVNRLSFSISGQLRALADDDRVQFDVLLEPSSLHYSIR